MRAARTVETNYAPSTKRARERAARRRGAQSRRDVSSARARLGRDASSSPAGAPATRLRASRRLALIGGISTRLLTRIEDAGASQGFDAPTFSNDGWNAFASTSESLSRRAYRVLWPSGWSALSDLASARLVGVDASWKNFQDEASTLAVFVTEARAGGRGTLDEDARLRAESAPNQRTIGKRTTRVRVPGGGDVEAHVIETEVGGGTAGRFGGAVELVEIFILDGREYLIRATASRSSWPRVKAQLRRCVDSFEFV